MNISLQCAFVFISSKIAKLNKTSNRYVINKLNSFETFWTKLQLTYVIEIEYVC